MDFPSDDFPAEKIVDLPVIDFPGEKIVDSLSDDFPGEKTVDFQETKTVDIKILDGRIEPHAMTTKTKGAAGIDLYCCNQSVHPLECGDIAKIPLGVAVAIPDGYVGLMTPRSSAGIRGFTLVNSLGVIDSDYRGELIAHITHFQAGQRLLIEPMSRLVQLVVVPHFQYSGAIWIVDDLGVTQRGAGGFGSTGD